MEAMPIIFIHYSNSSYLRFTLRCAKAFNPQARIILLGDQSNVGWGTEGIEHHLFADYANSPEIEKFDRVYTSVLGSKHGRPAWVRFVFKRWLYIYNFIRTAGIHQFWTFDSDNLILADLRAQTQKYAHVDCTEQCGGMCMNGLVNNQRVVKAYVETILELFEDEAFMAGMRKTIAEHPEYAYTEMAAYAECKRRKSIRTMRLNAIINGETFDDVICKSHDMRMQGGMKKVFFRNGHLYTFHLPSQKRVRLMGINMTGTNWVMKDLLYTYAVNNKLGKRPRNVCAVRGLMFIKYSLRKRLKQLVGKA